MGFATVVAIMLMVIGPFQIIAGVLSERTPVGPTKGILDVYLGEWLWAMLAFFFWFQAIWIFIRVFTDIFRRTDLSGAAKAGWILVLFVLPFLGALIYLIARPQMPEPDREGFQPMQ